MEGDRRWNGATISISQSTTPFQFGVGLARNWNFRPTTGSKSLFIIHWARSGPSVSARHQLPWRVWEDPLDDKGTGTLC